MVNESRVLGRTQRRTDTPQEVQSQLRTSNYNTTTYQTTSFSKSPAPQVRSNSREISKSPAPIKMTENYTTNTTSFKTVAQTQPLTTVQRISNTGLSSSKYNLADSTYRSDSQAKRVSSGFKSGGERVEYMGEVSRTETGRRESVVRGESQQRTSTGISTTKYTTDGRSSSNLKTYTTGNTTSTTTYGPVTTKETSW